MPTSAGDRKLAIKLLTRYGGEVDDYFKFWPKDKLYFFSSDNRAFLAYSIKYRVAACPFDPIGDQKSIEKLLIEFRDFLRRHCLGVIFIQTTHKYDKLYKQVGWHRLIVGSDALIDIDNFLAITVKNKYFRNIVNRFTKMDFHVEIARPPHSIKLISELKKVSDDWLNIPHHKEWGFLTGRFSQDYLKNLPIYILRDNKQQAIAFTNGLPKYRKKTASIDLIRRLISAPPNSIDFLFIEIMRSLSKDDKASYLNLGISPIDGSSFAVSWVEKGIMTFYRSSYKWVGFKGLHHFKAKYQPEWEPRYVYYSGPFISLAVKGLTILKLMLQDEIKV